MTTSATVSTMPTERQFERNLIGGRWQFPTAPYEYEIRNPVDSTITAVVPLSSRFDVADAVRAGAEAQRTVWAVAAERAGLLSDLVETLDAHRDELAALQSLETGLSLEDSATTLAATLQVARSVIRCGSAAWREPAPGTTGHVLSWGLPLTEVVTSVLPALVRGASVVVKPSLRGPLSAVAFAQLATAVGLPPGVVNIVQGTGVDIGADLITRGDLSALYVRAGARTTSLARRAFARTGVPQTTLTAGGNVAVVGTDTGLDVVGLLDTVVAGVRMHSAGGPFGLPLLAVHRDLAVEVTAAVVDALRGVVPAPLPTEPLRERARARIRELASYGGEVVLDGGLPDNIVHRMGWRLPPTVLDLGAVGSPAHLAEGLREPIGPVLSVVTWESWGDLHPLFHSSRSQDGIAGLWGVEDDRAHALEGVMMVGGSTSRPLIGDGNLPSGWTGGSW